MIILKVCKKYDDNDDDDGGEKAECCDASFDR